MKEHNYLQRYVDKNNEQHLLYPITKIENVDGAEEAIAELEQDIVTIGNEVFNDGYESVNVLDSEIISGKVAYIDTENKIATYDNSNATLLCKSVNKGEKFRIKSVAHGSINTLKYAICDTNGAVLQSEKMNVSPFTYVTTEITVPDEEGLSLYLNYVMSSTKPFIIEKYSLYKNSKVKGKAKIACWGDSLTCGVPLYDSRAYPYLLQNLTNMEVKNCGVGGEQPLTIASRQGSIPNIVQPFTIPSGTDSVAISLRTMWDDTSMILRSSGSAINPTTGKYEPTNRINPCKINGVEGTITFSNDSYYFTRSQSGTELVVSRPTVLETYAFGNYADYINVIWVGTNGGFKTAEDLINIIDTMIGNDKSLIKRYIVIGIHYKPSTVEESLIDIEKKMSIKYGRHYINERDYIVKYGLNDCGITPTEEDLKAIANGNIPPSLLADGDIIHFNGYGYSVITNLVYNRGKELRYW